MNFKLLTCVLAAAVSSPLFAQSARDPSSGHDMMAKSSSMDATFMKKLAEGDLAEVDAGRLANQKASSEGVKDFGQQMVTDHSKNSHQLKSLAAAHGIELPETIDAAHAAEKAKLEKTDGKNFDSQYLQSQIQAHDKALQLLQEEIRDGQDASLKEFANKTLPVVKHHLAMAKDLQAKM